MHNVSPIANDADTLHHIPVMINEVLAFTGSYPHTKILDGTLGLGGYSLAMLENFNDASIIGVDRDEQALSFSRERLKNYEASSRFTAIHANFGDIGEIEACRNCDVYVFDLGVSNMQLTLPERGFSFQNDGPLDMRMSPTPDTMTAAELLRILDEDRLTEIFKSYGDERYSRLIARAIKHSSTPITTTGDLVAIIRASLPQPVQRKMGTHPARRVFQALRIYINDEFGELNRLMKALPELSEHALIIFVAYHSIEDRLIKHTFKQWHSNGLGEIITRHPVIPSDEETANNYRARSAKLRAFLRSVC